MKGGSRPKMSMKTEKRKIISRDEYYSKIDFYTPRVNKFKNNRGVSLTSRKKVNHIFKYKFRVLL